MSALISAEQANWMERGSPSITLSSCDAAHAPSLAQGLGCRIDATRTRVTVFMLEPRNLATIADLRAGRAIAVVFTHGGSLRSLQLKAASAREVPLEPGDSDRINAYVGSIVLAWTSNSGVSEDFVYALLPRGPGTIVAFEFEPFVAFDQTPGPQAGMPLPRQP